VSNDTVSWTPLGPRVVAVEPMDDFRLFLTFTNGEKRIFDAKRLFKMPVFKLLRKKPFFETVKVDHGSVTWPGDIDYCPDTLYMESVPA
jgi:hypothetical protein